VPAPQTQVLPFGTVVPKRPCAKGAGQKPPKQPCARLARHRRYFSNTVRIVVALQS
jgi:hypothetical protein